MAESTFSPRTHPCASLRRSNETVSSSTWPARTMSSQARDSTKHNTTTRTKERREATYLSLTSCTLLCTVSWVSANNVVVKQSSQRDPPRLRAQTSMRERRGCTDARKYRLCIASRLHTGRELMVTRELYEINSISPRRGIFATLTTTKVRDFSSNRFGKQREKKMCRPKRF